MTLYTQVSNNRFKTWAYLGLYSLLILAIGWVASWYFDSPLILTVAAAIVIVQGWVSYYHSDAIALSVSGAVPLIREQSPRLFRIMENLSITAGLPMPHLYVIPDPALNAFATGRDAKHASIAVTQGLLERLDDNELAGVLAHELSHVGNEDIRLMSMVVVMAGLIALLSDWMLRSMWWGGGRRRDNEGGAGGYLLLIALVLAILAPIAATLIQLAISRKREFMADADGVLLTRYPEGLISALRKIGGASGPMPEASSATAHLFIANPLKGGGVAGLFATHPPIEARIQALEEGSGITA